MISVEIDGLRLSDHASGGWTTGVRLRDVVAAAAAEGRLAGKLVGSIRVNGAIIAPQALLAALDEPLDPGTTVHITSRSAAPLLAGPLGIARSTAQNTIQLIEHALAMLGDGEEAKGMERLVSLCGTLPLLSDGSTELISLLGYCRMDPGRTEELAHAHRLLRQHTAVLRELLATRDLESTVLLLSGPLQQVCRKLVRTLAYLEKRAALPRPRPIKSSATSPD